MPPVTHTSSNPLCAVQDLTNAEKIICEREWGDHLTFGHIHGRFLKSDGHMELTPYRRVLCFQHRRAVLKAKKEGWVLPEESPPAVIGYGGSTGSWQPIVDKFFESIEAAEATTTP